MMHMQNASERMEVRMVLGADLEEPPDNLIYSISTLTSLRLFSHYSPYPCLPCSLATPWCVRGVCPMPPPLPRSLTKTRYASYLLPFPVLMLHRPLASS